MRQIHSAQFPFASARENTIGFLLVVAAILCAISSALYVLATAVSGSLS
jgi:hypothetical protein